MSATKFRRGVVAAAACCVAVATASTAGAAPAPEAVDTVVDGFHRPPASLPAEPGAVVKTEPIDALAVAPGSDGAWPASAQQVMFTSRTQDDEPVAVTGTFVDSTGPWNGPGERPTVVIAPGTTGQADHCAPSAAFANGMYATTTPEPSFSVNQEAVSASRWSQLGARVFLTDYIGLGTPGIHTYANRAETGHAVLDAARAANDIAGDSDAPVLLWGYSQGGGATAAAAELAPSYAPDVNLKGVWAGAPVADLTSVLGQVDGTLIGGVIGYALNGFVDRNPELRARVDQIVTPEGRATLDRLATGCIGDVILKQPFLNTSDLTVDGRSMLDWLGEIPEAGPVLADQKIGKRVPTAPVLITNGVNDDTIPYEQSRRLADDWCGQGGDITFDTNDMPAIAPGLTIPDHFGPQIVDAYAQDKVMPFLLESLSGEHADGCRIG
ncbi:lipase family protein [Rhodococcus sp. HNM0569]|uniref:lipase family protein n=1 Tax=Rhodococcus sp. HNM0569 TaxID=2716340 RepID=UPI00146EC058|nr:lipase family protein [Rhodococcus sp. HNM0569]NLU83505.1 lipase [Rhodococcus sp. HNM0569]